jgi:deazaflavin-dependent oxidoreductase (nitroreductase family)
MLNLTITTPEYHHSVPAVLKNASDSVPTTFAFLGKPADPVGPQRRHPRDPASGARGGRSGRSGKVTAESPAGRGAGSVPAPVAPSRLVQTVIRPMTKVLNPLIVKLAGRRHFGMAAQIQHVGRLSGRVYVTPASARVHGDVIVIALTFGNQSDWARNVLAAGGCTIRIDGRSYRATNPRLLSREEAGPLLKSAFSPVQRAGMRVLGVRQFLRLQAAT